MPPFAIANFKGGVNNWDAPWKLDPSQAVALLDADVETGDIAPVAGTAQAENVPAEVLVRLANRSVAKFGEYWFWSDNTAGGLSSSLGYVGLAPPTSLPVCTPRARGTRFSGTYRYRCTFATAAGVESAPFPAAGIGGRFSTPVETTRESLVIVSGGFDAYSTKHFFPPTGNYYGYRIGDRVTHNGYDYECVQSFNKYAGYGALEATYAPGVSTKYWKDITESTITSTGFDSIDVSVPVPDEAAVTEIRVYRTAADGDAFYLVQTLARGATEFTDTMADEDLLLQATLDTEDCNQPPDDAKYLVELNEVYYAASGNKVYVSQQSNPHGWGALNYVSYPATVTALSSDKDGILVFTENHVWRLTGSTVADFVSKDLLVDQGCPNWRTIVQFRNMPLWLSNDGLCAYMGVPQQEGKFVEVLTENRYRFTEAVTHAVAANGVYWAFTDTGAVTIDLQSGLRVISRSETADRAFYDAANDRLLIEEDDVWYEVGAGALQEWAYTSPHITGGDQGHRKVWQRFTVNADSELALSAYIDGTLAQQYTIAAGITQRRLPRGTIGDRIHFEITGTGTLKALSVDGFPAMGE